MMSSKIKKYTIIFLILIVTGLGIGISRYYYLDALEQVSVVNLTEERIVVFKIIDNSEDGDGILITSPSTCKNNTDGKLFSSSGAFACKAVNDSVFSSLIYQSFNNGKIVDLLKDKRPIIISDSSKYSYTFKIGQ